jgi:large subunit ribosomal protein L25
MANLKLEANYRSDLSKSHMKAIRRGGYVTGSIFGHDAEPVSIEVAIKDLVEKIKGSDQGLMSLIDIEVRDAPKKSDGIVIIKEFHKNPITRRIEDIQFQRVSMKEKMSVTVPVVLIGEAAGARDGGILEQVANDLDVRCLPAEIPNKIEVDVSDLAIGHHIRVQDLQAVAGYEFTADPDTLICTCVAPHVSHDAEEGEAPTEGAAATEESA